MYFTIWVLMIMVYDCFTYEPLCIWMLKNKVEWSLKKKKEKKKKAMTKKKRPRQCSLILKKKKKRKKEKKRKEKEKKIKIHRPFQMVIYPSPQLSQKEL